MTPLATVVVPARDAAETIGATLAGLAAQELGGKHEVIVVDNGSRDDTAQIAERGGVRVVRRTRGDGPGAARNAGAAAAVAPVIAFTDADCVPAPGWLAAGLAALAGDADLVQGAVHPEREPGPLDRTVSVTAAWGLFETANLFVRRDLFDRLGGFGAGLEERGAPFGEDTLFGWRAVRAGARTGFCADAVVEHAVFPRAAGEYLAERRREGGFAGLVRRAPELREVMLYRRVFLNRRAAAWWAAAAGIGAATLARRPLLALAALPYARFVAGDRRAYGARVALVRTAGDAVGAAERARASLKERTPVL